MREGVEDDAVSEERHLVQALLAHSTRRPRGGGAAARIDARRAPELLNRLHLRVRVVLESMDGVLELGQAGTLLLFGGAEPHREAKE